MLSIVIPAFNEARRLSGSLERVFAYMDRRGQPFEVLVVDDGSTDGTAEVVRTRFGRRPELRVLTYGENRGKGYAVRHGLRNARGDLVLFTDADLSTPIEELEKLTAAVERGADVAIGTRAHPESRIEQRQPFYRDRAGKLFNAVVRRLLLPDLRDTQCGFKLFRRRRILPLLDRLRVDRFAFDVELLYLARRAGLRIAEVPVVWANEPDSRVRLLQAAAAFVDVVRIRLWHGRAPSPAGRTPSR